MKFLQKAFNKHLIDKIIELGHKAAPIPENEHLRLKDLEGTNSDLDHRNNFAFPTDITQEPS